MTARTLPPLVTPQDFAAVLADPSPQAWARCARSLDELWNEAHNPETPHPLPHLLGRAHEQLRQAVQACRAVILSWPAAARQAVPRDPLPNWKRAQKRSDQAHDAMLDLCLKVHETQTYEYFETYVCNDPRLLWLAAGTWGPSGSQQVHLTRSFTGAVRQLRSDGWLRIGEPGQGDLRGWFSIELPPFGVVAVTLELEVKMPEGRLSKKQRARAQELARAGGIYISAKSVRSAVGQLCVARDVLREAKGIGGVLEALDAYREAEGW